MVFIPESDEDHFLCNRKFRGISCYIKRHILLSLGNSHGIFAFKSMSSYGQRSKCADLLNSYIIFITTISGKQPALRRYI